MVDFRCKHPIFILNTESGPAFADMNTKPKQNRARSELNKHDIFCPCHNTTRQNRYGNWKCSFLWIFFRHLERFSAYVFMAVANFCRIPIFQFIHKIYRSAPPYTLLGNRCSIWNFTHVTFPSVSPSGDDWFCPWREIGSRLIIMAPNEKFDIKKIKKWVCHFLWVETL